MHSLIVISFCLVIGISFYGIVADKLPYSLNKIFFLFCLFFMGLAPLLQYVTGIMPFGWMQHQGNQESFIATNVLVLCCLFTFILVRKKTGFGPLIPPYNSIDFKSQSDVIARYKFGGNLVFLSAVFFQILISGNLWNRGLAEHTTIIANSSVQLLADKTLKGIVLYFCLLSLHFFRQKKIEKLQLFSVLFLSIISNFPTAVPRYWVAAFYGGILITFFHSFFIRRKHFYSVIVVAALGVAFPIIGTTRLKKGDHNFDFSSLENALNSIIKVFETSFCGQDFDAFASLRNTILYVQSHGLLWGKQLGTTLLFFIPRSIWPNKSVGSGAVVNAPRPGSDFNNYSSPLIAEGYLDFGLVGAIIFIGIFAFICSYYDKYYWQNQKNSFARIFYPAYLGMAFFTLRGDLLSSFAYTVGIVAGGWMFHKILWAEKKNDLYAKQKKLS